MITYQEIEDILLPKLDAENSQRYLPDQDIIPAINSAISRVQSGIGWALANRKGSEEAMRDFTRIAVYQTDTQRSSLLLDDALLPYTVANVVAVYAEPDVTDTSGNGILPLGATVSQYRSDVTWNGAGKPVRRVTLEQVGDIIDNTAMPGNEVLAANAGRRTYAYYVNGGRIYMLPKSQVSQQFVAVAHIAKFAPLADVNDTIDMPAYMADHIAMFALEFISWKQDPQGLGIGAHAKEDAARLFQFHTN